jgi:hypothetical protein
LTHSSDHCGLNPHWETAFTAGLCTKADGLLIA